MSCWGEYLAHQAGRGRDILSERMVCRELAADNTLEGAPADGAQGDPATGRGATGGVAAEPHETKSAPSSPFPEASAY